MFKVVDPIQKCFRNGAERLGRSLVAGIPGDLIFFFLVERRNNQGPRHPSDMRILTSLEVLAYVPPKNITKNGVELE